LLPNHLYHHNRRIRRTKKEDVEEGKKEGVQEQKRGAYTGGNRPIPLVVIVNIVNNKTVRINNRQNVSSITKTALHIPIRKAVMKMEDKLRERKRKRDERKGAPGKGPC